MKLTKAQIMQVEDIPFKDVEVEEWGGTVRIKGMTALERQTYSRGLIKGVRPDGSFELNMDKTSSVLFLQKVLVDDNGEPLFTEKEVEALGKKNPAIIDRLAKIGKELSGLEAGAVEDKEKN